MTGWTTRETAEKQLGKLIKPTELRAVDGVFRLN